MTNPAREALLDQISTELSRCADSIAQVFKLFGPIAFVSGETPSTDDIYDRLATFVTQLTAHPETKAIRQGPVEAHVNNRPDGTPMIDIYLRMGEVPFRKDLVE